MRLAPAPAQALTRSCAAPPPYVVHRPPSVFYAQGGSWPVWCVLFGDAITGFEQKYENGTGRCLCHHATGAAVAAAAAAAAPWALAAETPLHVLSPAR